MITGVPATDLTNRRIRKTDLAVISAINKLSTENVSEPLVKSMLQALSSAVRQTAEPYFTRLALDQSRSDLLLLAVDKQIATDVWGRHFHPRFALSTYLKVEQ